MTAPSPDLIVHSREPFNAEPALERLRASFITAQADFYIRSHGDVPRLDEASHRLTVGGHVATPLTLSLADLRGWFPQRTVMAVMQCAGNRRADMAKVRPVTGDLWAGGAIGNAAWTGVALADVLHAAGAKTDADLHVAFSSLDECEVDGKRFRYGASIPMAKAMSPDVLLAYAMNGEALAPAHGFPLRVVVPGFAGVRSPKWVAAIEVRDTPSDNPIQDQDYKMLPPDIHAAADIDWSRGVTINDMPLNAAICEPPPHAMLRAGATIVRGYAVATARAIVRVDVSMDGGRTWRQADLRQGDLRQGDLRQGDLRQGETTPWSWTFWSIEAELTAGEHELAVRAWDSAGQTQPASPDDTWNIKGYLSAAWHRVPVTVR